MSDKILINLFGLTISAGGIYAIVAAVNIIMLVLAAAAAMFRHCNHPHRRRSSYCHCWTRG